MQCVENSGTGVAIPLSSLFAAFCFDCSFFSSTSFPLQSCDVSDNVVFFACNPCAFLALTLYRFSLFISSEQIMCLYTF